MKHLSEYINEQLLLNEAAGSWSDVIEKDAKSFIKKNKVTGNVTLYIDSSGSMHDAIENVQDAAYPLSVIISAASHGSANLFAFSNKITGHMIGDELKCSGPSNGIQYALNDATINAHDDAAVIIISDDIEPLSAHDIADALKAMTAKLYVVTNYKGLGDNGLERNVNKELGEERFKIVIAGKDFE